MKMKKISFRIKIIIFKTQINKNYKFLHNKMKMITSCKAFKILETLLIPIFLIKKKYFYQELRN